jgi:hypothetical protein
MSPGQAWTSDTLDRAGVLGMIGLFYIHIPHFFVETKNKYPGLYLVHLGKLNLIKI